MAQTILRYRQTPRRAGPQSPAAPRCTWIVIAAVAVVVAPAVAQTGSDSARTAPVVAPDREPWPASCRETRETIFDRVERITDTLVAVPRVPRLEVSMGIDGRYVSIGDARLWVEEVGTGPPLVLVSGGPGTGHHYFHPHLYPAGRFARLIYYDPRGVGLSDREPGAGYTVAQAAEDLDRLRRRLGFDRWILLGYSFGGTIAQYYALHYPEHLAGLVLASSAVPMDMDVGLRSREHAFMTSAEVERVAEIYRIDGEAVVPAHGGRVDPAMQRRMVYNGFLNGDWKRRHLCRMRPTDIAQYVRHEWVHDRDYYFDMVRDGQRYDLTGAFAESPMPTLILEGKWDLAFGEHKARVFADQFPGARLAVLEDAGHTLFEDEPARFFTELRDFVTNLTPPSAEAVARWKAAVEGMTLRPKPSAGGASR